MNDSGSGMGTDAGAEQTAYAVVRFLQGVVRYDYLIVLPGCE